VDLQRSAGMTDGSGQREQRGARGTLRGDRWLALLTMTRLIGASVAVGLLLAHQVTDHDTRLALVTVAWTAATLLGFARSARLRAAPAAWAIDMFAALALVLASEDWRSPFYVFALTTLVLPATMLPWRAALAWGTMYSALYAGVAMLTRQLPSDTLSNTIRLETHATHLFVPIIITLALAYAGILLQRLRAAREASERLVVEAERRRIAWDLHDSAKQRVHAAHLLLTALAPGPNTELVEAALSELRGATADMETSVAELRAPLDGRPVEELLRERAGELARAGAAENHVSGRLPTLSPLVAAHAYRIASEALTNAVRHARCGVIHITLHDHDGRGELIVADDGIGLPVNGRMSPGGHGLRSMRGRAETIGAELDIGPGPGGRGTRVALALPHPGGSQ
jgi:two-component system sensor histidine kinase UhpB